MTQRTARRQPTATSVNMIVPGARGQPQIDWLYKAVVAMSNGTYVYGQVVATAGDLSIQTRGTQINCSPEDVVEVAPVICFLMGSSNIATSTLSLDTLTEQHHTILDRLFGTNGETATRSIPRLLRQILPLSRQPSATDTWQWLQAATGTSVTVSVRHAVDYAHFIDGERASASAARQGLGSSFDDDPQFRDEHPTQPVVEDQPLTDLLAALRPTLPGTDQTPPSSRPIASSHDDALRSKILAAIADEPDLVRFYLTECVQSTKRLAQLPSPVEPPSQRRRLDAPSDLLVYGKLPQEIVDAMISSPAAKFCPHPAIISRVYDFQFGVRGLSIAHFRRFDLTARRKWFGCDNKVNLSNFSPTVELPRADRPGSLEDVSKALVVLLAFVKEFFDDSVYELVMTAHDFIEDLRGFCEWTPTDVETLTFWFDSVFEAFRHAAEADVHTAADSRERIHQKISMQDPELQSILFVIQAEKVAALDRRQHGFRDRHPPALRPDPQAPPHPPRHIEPHPDAELALRLSMLAVLGPGAVNEKKFSRWEVNLAVLGLEWDTELKTVSMPKDKLDKAQGRIASALASGRVSKLALAQLLGSLRHVGICCPTARAFLQRLHHIWRRTAASGSTRLPDDVKQDLHWVSALLAHGALTSVPTSLLAGSLAPQVHLFMDASNDGLCILYPEVREYIRVRFDAAERDAIQSPQPGYSFDINVREALSVVYAALTWGPRWHAGDSRKPTHIRCWLDNRADPRVL
ncbi:hypothetical protein P43SY_011179 [Pythium insidiosum]|uniref:Uncharacterized protein n=1 Tax=Pythium insidiosum TaxID=114742 RepID=A0AAD5L6X0_PYTIN|nr:hypothetical protein P43SY_011179 [Pythium insidiosum]